MAKRLLDRLEAEIDGFTAAERSIANFILTNRNTIAFETAASLADKLGVSAVTVGRFCRRLGYLHFKDIKNELKTDIGSTPWLMGDQLAAFAERARDQGQLKKSLELEVANLVEVYTLAKTPAWEEIVSLLVSSGSVYVVGFQTERGMGMLLATEMQYVREGVHLIDVAAGNFAELFAGSSKGKCLVVVESRRYSKQAYLLCEQARRAGIPVVVITDKYCDWARKFSAHVLAVSTESGMFWSSSVGMTAVINLLLNSMVGKLGTTVEPRLKKLSELYQTFTGHVGAKNKKVR